MILNLKNWLQYTLFNVSLNFLSTFFKQAEEKQNHEVSGYADIVVIVVDIRYLIYASISFYLGRLRIVVRSYRTSSHV